MSITLAQSNAADPSIPEICEVDLKILKSNNFDPDPNIVTADTVSAQGTTIPSLWWTSEQFPPRSIANWIANRQEKRIYLFINTNYWDMLDYIDRYQTINKFGRVSQDYGYNLNICNSQKVVLARYTCEPIDAHIIDRNSSAATLKERDRNCQIWLNTTGQNGLGVQTQ